MRTFCLFLASAACAAAAAPGTLLPPVIPGYELRVLDVRKPIIVNAGGASIALSVPVFFYYPRPASPQALPLVRQAYDDLAILAAKPEWTAAELQPVLARLDAAVRLLEQPAPAAPRA